MIEIDTKKILQRIVEEREGKHRADSRPMVELLPAEEVVYVDPDDMQEPLPELNLHEELEQDLVHREDDNRGRGELAADLVDQMRDLKIARARLSNQLSGMYREGSSQNEVERHVARIQGYTDQMKVVYDRQRHVERYGKLPDPEPPKPSPLDSTNIMKLKEHRRTLVDKRCKLKRKLQPNARQPVNSSRRILWQEELDRVELEYKHVKKRIRDLNQESDG